MRTGMCTGPQFGMYATCSTQRQVLALGSRYSAARRTNNKPLPKPLRTYEEGLDGEEPQTLPQGAGEE